MVLCIYSLPIRKVVPVHVCPSRVRVSPARIRVSPSLVRVSPSRVRVSPPRVRVGPSARHVSVSARHVSVSARQPVTCPCQPATCPSAVYSSLVSSRSRTFAKRDLPNVLRRLIVGAWLRPLVSRRPTPPRDSFAKCQRIITYFDLFIRQNTYTSSTEINQQQKRQSSERLPTIRQRNEAINKHDFIIILIFVVGKSTKINPFE